MSMTANLINNLNIQKFCLGLISSIHLNIFNEDTIFNLIDIGLRKNTSLSNTNDTIDNDYVNQNLFTFFLKGGNAMPFLERYRNSKKNIPFTFDGDFNCEFLINPELEDDVFIDIRNYFVLHILRAIHNFISELNVNPGLNSKKDLILKIIMYQVLLNHLTN